jgi:hypothetical protein
LFISTAGAPLACSVKAKPSVAARALTAAPGTPLPPAKRKATTEEAPMFQLDTRNWIVFALAGRELVRITAAETTADEPAETRALLAYEQGCPVDHIDVSLDEA